MERIVGGAVGGEASHMRRPVDRTAALLQLTRRELVELFGEVIGRRCPCYLRVGTG